MPQLWQPTDRPFNCEACDKTFTHHHHLVTHERTHTNERPYKCTNCEKRFNQNGSLRRHIRTHTGEKPFACSVCDYRTSDKGNLRKHEKIHNAKQQESRPPNRKVKASGKGKTFDCLQCDKKFSDTGHLMEHEKVHQNNEHYSCEQCDKTFENIEVLRNHQQECEMDYNDEVSMQDDGQSVKAAAVIDPGQNTAEDTIESSDNNEQSEGNASEDIAKSDQSDMTDNEASENCDADQHLETEMKGDSFADSDNDVDMTEGLSDDSEVSFKITPKVMTEDELSEDSEVTFKITPKVKIVRYQPEGAKETFSEQISDQENPGGQKESEPVIQTNVLGIGFEASETKNLSEKEIEDYMYELNEALGKEALANEKKDSDSKPLSCETCNKQFSSASRLKVHDRVHTKERPYECGTCDKRFTQKQALNRHKVIHTGEKPFKCSSCDYRCNERGNLKKHERTHLKIESPTKKDSDICNEEGNMKTNQKTHVDNGVSIKKANDIKSGRPYTCEHCGKKFFKNKSLKKHKIKCFTASDPDINEKPLKKKIAKVIDQEKEKVDETYSCIQCNKNFSNFFSLKRHTKLSCSNKSSIKSKKGVPHTCKQCNEIFHNTKAFKRHKIKCKKSIIIKTPEGSPLQFKSHQPPVQVKIDGTDFISPMINTMLVKKQFICPHCANKFRDRKALKIHKKKCPNSDRIIKRRNSTGNNKHFNCTECDQTFADTEALKYHEIWHTFKCNNCEKIFPDKATLHIHEQTHSDKSPEPEEKREVSDFIDNMKTEPEEQIVTESKEEERIVTESKDSKVLETDREAQNFSETNQDQHEEETSEETEKTHYDTSPNGRPYKCTNCDKRFTQNGSLRRHMRTHTGEKPFACSQCDYRTSDKGNLKKHEKKHSVNKQHESRPAYEAEMEAQNINKPHHEQSEEETLVKTGENPNETDMETEKAQNEIDMEADIYKPSDILELKNLCEGFKESSECASDSSQQMDADQTGDSLKEPETFAKRNEMLISGLSKQLGIDQIVYMEATNALDEIEVEKEVKDKPKCQTCGKKIKNKYALLYIQRHANEKPINCYKCENKSPENAKSKDQEKSFKTEPDIKKDPDVKTEQVEDSAGLCDGKDSLTNLKNEQSSAEDDHLDRYLGKWVRGIGFTGINETFRGMMADAPPEEPLSFKMETTADDLESKVQTFPDESFQDSKICASDYQGQNPAPEPIDQDASQLDLSNVTNQPKNEGNNMMEEDDSNHGNKDGNIEEKEWSIDDMQAQLKRAQSEPPIVRDVSEQDLNNSPKGVGSSMEESECNKENKDDIEEQEEWSTNDMQAQLKRAQKFLLSIPDPGLKREPSPKTRAQPKGDIPSVNLFENQDALRSLFFSS